jgi:zinc transport system ATP-binding protein
MSCAIQIDKLSFSYRDTLVLKDVSFQIPEGEFVGIIGPNGGGKTTLLKLILGFLQPTSGKVEIFGQLPQASLSQVAYVPQTLRFDREFPISVLELVLCGRLSHLPWYGKFKRSEKKAALGALEKVGLIEFQDHSFGQLSGGQAQRALIARALVSEPRLLLLDEPTASVDSQAQADIYAILKTLSKSMTILMVTHDLGIAINQVQKVICVQGGAFDLKPEEVCKHFALGLYHSPFIQVKEENPLRESL